MGDCHIGAARGTPPDFLDKLVYKLGTLRDVPVAGEVALVIETSTMAQNVGPKLGVALRHVQASLAKPESTALETVCAEAAATGKRARAKTFGNTRS